MFLKYDVCTTQQPVYCYIDTDVLINKLNIRDKAELKQAEEEFTAIKQMTLLQEPIKGRFTKAQLPFGKNGSCAFMLTRFSI